MVGHAREQLAYYTSFIPAAARRIIDTSRMRLDHLKDAIPLAVSGRVTGERTRLTHLVDIMKAALNNQLERQQMRLEALTDKVSLLSPQNTLNRGYALVSRSGQIVTDAAQLNDGDPITIHLRDGNINAQCTMHNS